MSVDIDAQNDFAQLADGLETATLRRKDTNNSAAISAARRFDVVAQEATPSDGAARQADAIWHFQLPTGETAPAVGDVVVDQLGSRWTILEVHEFSLLGRWKCVTRELSVAFSCLDRVDIERAVWGDLGAGPVIVDWIYVRTAMPVKIQPEGLVIVDGNVTPPVWQAQFQIILSESVALEADDRFVAEDGTVYRLQSYAQAERIDALPMAKVWRDDTAGTP